MQGQVIQQCIDMQVTEESNNGCFDVCKMKILDLEEVLEDKEEAYNKLERACKEAMLYHQNKCVTLKKKFMQNEELLKERKVKKACFSSRKVG